MIKYLFLFELQFYKEKNLKYNYLKILFYFNYNCYYQLFQFSHQINKIKKIKKKMTEILIKFYIKYFES